MLVLYLLNSTVYVWTSSISLSLQNNEPGIELTCEGGGKVEITVDDDDPPGPNSDTFAEMDYQNSTADVPESNLAYYDNINSDENYYNIR